MTFPKNQRPTPAELRAWRASFPVKNREHITGPVPAGLSQTAAAMLLGVSYQAYADWERGRHPAPCWLMRHPRFRRRLAGLEPVSPEPATEKKDGASPCNRI